MYTVNKGPSKFVAKTRGGLSKNIEKFETIREISRKCSDNAADVMEMQLQRPVFHQTRHNRTSHQHNQHQHHQHHHSQHHQQHQQNLQSHLNLYSNQYYPTGSIRDLSKQINPEPPNPQHEELVKFIQDSWNCVTSNPYDSNENDIVNDDNDEACVSPASPSLSSSSSLSPDCISSSSSLLSVSSTWSSSAIDPPRIRQTAAAVYHNDPPSAALKDFGAFDLESWWGRRLFNNITKTL